MKIDSKDIIGENKENTVVKKTCPFKFGTFLGPKAQPAASIISNKNIPELAQYNTLPECNKELCEASYKDASGKDACSICDAAKAYIKVKSN